MKIDNRIFWVIAILGLLYFLYRRGITIDAGTQTITASGTGANDGNGDGVDGEYEAINDDISFDSARLFGSAPSSICIEPSFPTSTDFSGMSCSGQYINEDKVLQKGDFGCDVLLLQQRLNAIENKNILSPSGRFDCATLGKLNKVKGVRSISLNSFQPDEEIGFDEFSPTRIKNPNYSYMNIDMKN